MMNKYKKDENVRLLPLDLVLEETTLSKQGSMKARETGVTSLYSPFLYYDHYLLPSISQNRPFPVFSVFVTPLPFLRPILF